MGEKMQVTEKSPRALALDLLRDWAEKGQYPNITLDYALKRGDWAGDDPGCHH